MRVLCLTLCLRLSKENIGMTRTVLIDFLSKVQSYYVLHDSKVARLMGGPLHSQTLTKGSEL